ncbi:hypothetical protein AAJP84_07090 [Bartonella schoenbuchensis]|uniref:hypothetical protein n=1 Tax=Bartonella schoenbuchensis TaxID=165694 RepID=UPI0031CC3E89
MMAINMSQAQNRALTCLVFNILTAIIGLDVLKIFSALYAQIEPIKVEKKYWLAHQRKMQTNKNFR